MSHPGADQINEGIWRRPDLIASAAFGRATLAEEGSQNAGLIYVLCDILTALHRQAEALERIACGYEQTARGAQLDKERS